MICKMHRGTNLTLGTLLSLVLLLSCSGVSHAQDASAEKALPVVGPATEKRFPPLQVPEGFQPTLFACDPLVEYPSVISIGPRLGTLFVAHDYVTGLGVEIVRRDEIRLLEDANDDGYADSSTLYADGFNSVQGLAYFDGAVYVMHAPLLTTLRDTDGDNVADQRLDLIKGLGLPPEENSNRLHCANGVVVGHDGWLYLALGDRGCDVVRPEGDRLLFREGGILRCRSDGTDLHVFSHGLRNIYDVALDDELHVFTRDNENDGGDYMIRVCHSFYGADHGYPYLYYERPEEAMPPMADLARGSSAGAVCYLETAFPPKYRGGLFCCEWGRAVVWYPRQRAGSGFGPATEFDFAAGAPDDRYGFKPTDLVVDYDGSMLSSDWCDGQRPKRGRGRIYRVRYIGDSVEQASPLAHVDLDVLSIDDLIVQLNSTSQHRRVAAQNELQQRGDKVLPRIKQQLRDVQPGVNARLHLTWLLVKLAEEASLDDLLRLAEDDRDSRVQAQAIRAIGDLFDPILKQHRLEFAAGDEGLAPRLAKLARGADSRVLLETVIALRRLHWQGLPTWLQQNIKHPDPTLAHAVMDALRYVDQWEAVARLLDETNTASSMPTLALRALADQADITLVDGLIERLRSEPVPQRRREYCDLLARVYKEPAPWTYWGFRPAPRPANSVHWERTDAIAAALNEALHDSDTKLRAFVLSRMQREAVPVELTSLQAWLADDRDANPIATILEELNKHSVEESRPLLERVVSDRDRTPANRITALRFLIAGLQDSEKERMLDLTAMLEDGVVLAAALTELGGFPQLKADELLLAKLNADEPSVRAAAITALGQRKTESALAKIGAALSDEAISVRRAAARAAGTLQATNTRDQLLELAASDDPELRRACLLSLRELKDPRAAALAASALEDNETQLAALQYLRDYGNTEQTSNVMKLANSTRSVELLSAIAETFAAWLESDRRLPPLRGEAIARLNGLSGTILTWQVVPAELVDPDSNATAAGIDVRLAAGDVLLQRSPSVASGPAAEISLSRDENASQEAIWMCAAITVNEAADVEFLGSSDGTFRVWLNGDVVHDRKTTGSFRADSERFGGSLRGGMNRVVVRVEQGGMKSRLHLRFRRKSSQAEHERLVQAALSQRGSPLRGREVFFNAQKSQCVKCHRIGQEGATIAPDLSDIGRRFSRIHLIESILEPSRSIAPSYGSLSVVLESGQMVTGVKVRETTDLLVLADNLGKLHEIVKATIDELQVQPKSIMPEGLEKQLSEQDFLDLIEFLIAQTERQD